MFSLFVLCLMAELIAIAAQGVRIACMLPCISEATAAQRCICNVKFCHIRFASSQTFQVVNCGDHRDLHWCTRTFAWLKCMHTIALIVLVLPTFAVFIFQCSGHVRPVHVFSWSLLCRKQQGCVHARCRACACSCSHLL